LSAEINNLLESENIIMSEGRINIIDATPIEAAQSGSVNGKNGTSKKPLKQVGMLRMIAEGAKSLPIVILYIQV